MPGAQRFGRTTAALPLLLIAAAAATVSGSARNDAFIGYTELQGAGTGAGAGGGGASESTSGSTRISHAEAPDGSAAQQLIAPDQVLAVALESVHGRIRLRLRRDWAPNACQKVAELALAGCSGCTWYRHEPDPPNWGVNNFYGPPYGLLQGGFTMNPAPAAENPKGLAVTRGRVAFITPGADFFMGTVDHSEWGSAFSVWGEVLGEEDMAAQARLPFEPYRNSTDGSGITTRWLLERFAFTIHPLGAEDLLRMAGSGSSSGSGGGSSGGNSGSGGGDSGSSGGGGGGGGLGSGLTAGSSRAGRGGNSGNDDSLR